jgi:hypothetical protein
MKQMKTIKRKSEGTHFSMCVQPDFILVQIMMMEHTILPLLHGLALQTKKVIIIC